MQMTLSEYACHFIGVDYQWGGDSVEEGYDCSGFIQEVLSSKGLDPKGDQTAQALYNHFIAKGKKNALPSEESLLFFGKSKDKITHVALALNGHQMIEAGGEGRVSTTKGMVRIRPISNRNDLIAAIEIPVWHTR